MSDINIIDFMDLIEYTLSEKFMSKWKPKYGSRFVNLFQLKFFEYFKDQKIIKRTTLTNFRVKKGKYKVDLVKEFFSDIDIDIYSPFVVID